MTVGWISFTNGELAVLSGLLGLQNPWPSPNPLDSVGAPERTEMLDAAADSLRRRGAMRPVDGEVAIPVAELLLLVARPLIRIEVCLAGTRVARSARFGLLCGNGRAVVEVSRDGESLRFTPHAGSDLLPRLVHLTQLDQRDRTAGAGFTASLVALDQCKQAAESGDEVGAASILNEAGVSEIDARAFSRALLTAERSVAVRASLLAGRRRHGVELFWLDAPTGRWALPTILSPFARSNADRAGPEEEVGSWTVDPETIALSVTPTDADELIGAVNDVLVAAATMSRDSGPRG